MDREREAVFRGNERDGRRVSEREWDTERRRRETERERETRSVYSFNTRAGEGGQKRSAKGMRRERKIASAGV